MIKIILGIIVVLVVVVAGFVLYGNNFMGAPAAPQVNNNNQISSDNSGQGTALDLSSQGLNKIPEQVFSKTSLEVLDVSHNNLTGAIQSQIGQLINLKVLNASDNKMTGVPAEIGQLQKLEVLDLSNNQLTGLPNELGNLQNLKVLNLSGNQYSQQDLDYIKSKLPATTQIITD